MKCNFQHVRKLVVVALYSYFSHCCPLCNKPGRTKLTDIGQRKWIHFIVFPDIQFDEHEEIFGGIGKTIHFNVVRVNVLTPSPCNLTSGEIRLL